MRPFLIFTILFLSQLCGDEITGFWQTLDDKTNKPTSLIAIYQYKGLYYGRIIASYNSEGVMDDTIYHPKAKATGIAHTPYYCGTDIIWDVKIVKKNLYRGYVIDPRSGSIYDADIWRDGPNLILRGKVLIFWKTQTWPPFAETNFTKQFPKPDVNQFKPVIPQPYDTAK